MRFERTTIAGVAIVRLDFHEDERGAFARTFCEAELAAAGLDFRIVQANLSRNSKQHTLRGLHYQYSPYGEPKIVSCPRGRIWDVAVDMREESPTYRRWEGFELSASSGLALHLPEGIAHGFLSLEPDSDVQYLMGAAYIPSAATGLRWDDPAIGITWPAAPAIISERDRRYPYLEPTD